MTISQLLSARQDNVRYPRGDRHYVTSCTTCGFTTTLNELRLIHWGDCARYLCPLCGHIVVAVEPVDEHGTDTHHGTRIGDYVIETKADITTSYAGGLPAIAGTRTPAHR